MAWVYNLTVDEAHTYFIGTGQWLVHNCPPIWTPSPKKGFNDIDNANYHWNKHQHEFPEYSNSSEYIQGASDFINNPPTTAHIRVSSSGTIVVYDPVSNQLGIYTPSKTPITYYKPDPAVHSDGTNWNHFMNRS